MASDPTDLIREADEALDGITTGQWVNEAEAAGNRRFIAAAPDLVRRLRDAYADKVDTTKLVMTSLNEALDVLAKASGLPDEATEDIDLLYETVLGLPAALAEANATIERFEREVNMIAAHRTDWDDNGPEHDEWLASLEEKRLGGPDIAYRGIQYAVMRLRRAIERAT